MAHDRALLDLGGAVKLLNMSVTDFGQKNVLNGDINETSGVGQVSAELGTEIHREIQDRRSREIADYSREVQVAGQLPSSTEASIKISGRIDGMWSDGDEVIIEEIKSTLNVRRLSVLLQDDLEHSYILQVKIYGWLLWKQRGVIPKLQLLLVTAGSREEKILPIDFNPVEFSQWIEQRKAFLLELWLEVTKFKKQRKRLAKSLEFPFSKKRRGQSDLMRDVANACKKKSQFLAQAPTGLGKTAAVMFPMLKSALRRADKLFYVTPKNSQLHEAEKFLNSVSARDGGPLGLILTAKPKICMQAEVKCTPEACPYAKGHYNKVNNHGLLQRLRNERVINGDTLRAYATQHEVCPYELGRQVMPWVDVVAGDYHYALSPQASLRESAKLPLAQEPKPLLAIDEAHNLSERAIDWYSHRVSGIPDDVLSLAPKKIKKSMSRLNQWLQAAMTRGLSGAVIKTLNREDLVSQVNSWTAEMPLILENAEENSDVQRLVNEWFSWLAMSELCQRPEELFFATRSPCGQALDLHCANAGPLLREALSKFHAIVAFSATLKPFSFHQDMNGFDESRVVTKEYPSPFPIRNRRIIAIPQVSTAWRDRPRSLPRIVDVIERIIALRQGNYMAFFPSFDMLKQALPLIEAEGFHVIEQPPAASVAWVRDLLKRLRKSRGILVLAVQGGVLSEGIDLPGEQLIGAFIVGPALSMVTPEREERRKLLGTGVDDGFAKAYSYPAMARSIQSAGRVIRSPEDRGIIIMMDPRFLKEPYLDALPSDWLGDKGSTDSLLSQSILSDLTAFWADEKNPT